MYKGTSRFNELKTNNPTQKITVNLNGHFPNKNIYK